MHALERDGFRWTTTVGSHRVYVNASGQKIVVSFHAPGRTFPPGTLNTMLKRVRWTEDDLVRLGLLRRRGGAAARAA